MSAFEQPIPAEVFYDEAPPLSDEDLDQLFAAVEHLADGDADVVEEVAFHEAMSVLAGPDDLPSTPHAQATARWEVTDDTAAWAAAKYAEASVTLDQLAVQAEEWRARIEHWFRQASRRHARTAAFMEQRLEQYALRVREDGGPATIPLPAATLRTTVRKPSVIVEDDDAVAAWADSVPAGVLEEMLDGVELVHRTVKVAVVPLRKLVRVQEEPDGAMFAVGLDGEPVAGAGVRPGSVTASVDVNR